MVDKLSIANPNVRFKLVNNKKVLLQTNGNGDMKSIMGNIYGLATVKNLMEAQASINGVNIKCYLAEPLVNKSRKTGITIVVNGRSVKNYQLVNGVVEGYDTYIPIGRYPVSVIFINLDPMLIDVNVHPTKSEIRVSNEEEIKDLIKNTIKNELTKTPLIPEVSDEFKNSPSKLSSFYNYDNKKDTINNQIRNEILLNVNKIDKPLNEEIKININYDTDISNEVLEEEQQTLSKLPYLEYIGQYAGTYLLFQNEKGLYLMDQHAAAERIRYEKYIKELSNPTNISQELLTPLLIDVTKSEKIYILDNLELFKNLGVELDDAGDNTLYIRSIPIWINKDPEAIILEMIKHIIENKKVDIKSIRDEFAKLISCKGAIKANRYTSKEEVNALVMQLSKCDNPFTCPHGRPTIITLTQYEIEKMFYRVM